MNNTKIFELNRQDIDLYKKQILDGGYKKKYKKSKYPEDIDREESRIIKNITEEEFKDHMVRVARELVEEGNIPNFKIFKKVFDDDELHFYFPSLFKNAPSPPVFIGKAHIGDTQIAGGDIVGGIKITTDKSTTVDNRGGIIQRSSIGSEETKGRIKNCPYCGEDLDFPKSPKYCPYCGGQIIE